MTSAPSTSSVGHSSESTFSPTSSFAATSSTLSAIDSLHDTFTKRIRSLTHLKRSLRGSSTWFSTIQLSPTELAAAFDNDRMSKRTLRYFLLGLSLSSVLEIGNPSDLARAVISLIGELEACTDEQIAAMTSGAGAGNFGAGQRLKVKSFFKTGKQSLKRSTAAQAISEFGTIDSIGPATTGTNEQSSYLMAPNMPFQMDFSQTFFTLCDILAEVYYKMLSFLPKEPKEATAEGSYATFPRAASPASTAEHELGSISQALSTDTDTAATAISSMSQELLLKADARIKKIINAQVKDIDNFARQAIKDELASLDPLMKEVAVDSTSSLPQSQASSKASSTTGLPNTTSTLPFTFTQPSSTSSAASTPSKSFVNSHFRRSVKQDPTRTSQDSHHGHHQFHLSSIPPDEADPSPTSSKSGRLRNSDKDSEVPVYPRNSATSPT